MVKASLKEKGVGVKQAENSGITPLWIASQNGHVDVVKALLKENGIGVTQAYNMGFTPLWRASQHVHVNVV